MVNSAGLMAEEVREVTVGEGLSYEIQTTIQAQSSTALQVNWSCLPCSNTNHTVMLLTICAVSSQNITHSCQSRTVMGRDHIVVDNLEKFTRYAVQVNEIGTSLISAVKLVQTQEDGERNAEDDEDS